MSQLSWAVDIELRTEFDAMTHSIDCRVATKKKHLNSFQKQ